MLSDINFSKKALFMTKNYYQIPSFINSNPNFMYIIFYTFMVMYFIYLQFLHKK